MFCSFSLTTEDKGRSEEEVHITYNEWHHFASSFTGLGDGEIFKTYCDGTICDEDDDWSFDVITGPGNGIVVIGRSYTNLHNGYASVELDELLFFNLALEVQEVEALYQ